MISVLFVCLGNICRSPAAEAILRQIAQDRAIGDLHVHSCGTGDWHIGQLADERMREAAKVRGYTISKRAEQFDEDFLNHYDYILASDQEVIKELYYYTKTPGHKAKIHLMTAFSPSYKDTDVPDPYYQGFGAFDQVITILEDACEGFLETINPTEQEENHA